MAVEPAQVGIEATRLMDDLVEEELPDDAEIVGIGLVVEVAYEGEDGDNPCSHVMMRCSLTERVRQIGLFETAKHIALTSGD